MKTLRAGLVAALLLGGCGGIDALRPGSPPDPANGGVIGSDRDANKRDRGDSVDPTISI